MAGIVRFIVVRDPVDYSPLNLQIGAQVPFNDC